MTLKQRKLLRNLETSKTLMEAGLKAGYSEKAKSPYRKYNKIHIAEIIHSDPEAIKARFNDIADKASAKEDFTAELRATEALARINAMFTDKSEVKTTPINEIRITHINTKPSDGSAPINRIPKEAEKHE